MKRPAGMTSAKGPASEVLESSEMKKRRIVELAMEADRKGAQDRTAYVNNVLPDVSKSQISRLLAAEKARRQGLITKDCTLHSFPGMRKHDEGFFVCVLYRIILSLRKRKRVRNGEGNPA